MKNRDYYKITICFMALSMILVGCGNRSLSLNDDTDVSKTEIMKSEDSGIVDVESQVQVPQESEKQESEKLEQIEILNPSNDTFVRVQDYIPTIQQDLRYATTNNFTGQVIYTFEEAYLRYGTVKKLQQVCEELETYGIGIKIWDAFRPLQAQAKLWEVCPDEKYVSHPNKGNRNHCRGLAVDITLYDLKTGEELEMPSGFDEFSALGDREYSDCSAKATENSKLLESIMTKCGFKGYSKEWWHYNDTDTYPIEEVFVPAE